MTVDEVSSQQQPVQGTSNDNLGLIVGLSVAVLVVVIIAIAIYFCRRRNLDDENTILVEMNPLAKVYTVNDDDGDDLEGGPKPLKTKGGGKDNARISIKMGKANFILQGMSIDDSNYKLPPIDESQKNLKAEETIRELEVETKREGLNFLQSPKVFDFLNEEMPVPGKAYIANDIIMQDIPRPVARNQQRDSQGDNKLGSRDHRSKIGGDNKINNKNYDHLDADLVLQTIS